MRPQSYAVNVIILFVGILQHDFRAKNLRNVEYELQQKQRGPLIINCRVYNLFIYFERET